MVKNTILSYYKPRSVQVKRRIIAMAKIIYMLTSIQSEWKVQLKSSSKTHNTKNTIDKVIFLFSQSNEIFPIIYLGFHKLYECLLN